MMLSRLGTFFLTAACFGLVSALVPTPSSAADMALKAPAGRVGHCSDVVFVCENGQQYPLCPIAVSVIGEVVTGTLHSPVGATHVRLIPMGEGYRYAGQGVSVDGFQNHAEIHIGERSHIACTIHQPQWADAH